MNKENQLLQVLSAHPKMAEAFLCSKSLNQSRNDSRNFECPFDRLFALKPKNPV